jgi:hypothetical protein
VLISRGRLVYAFVVEGQLASDGTLELISIELDLTAPNPPASMGTSSEDSPQSRKPIVRRAGGQSQHAFPGCRCNATACSSTVARSRSDLGHSRS